MKATILERISQNAANLSLPTMYKNLRIDAKERDPVETFEHILANTDKGHTSNLPENAKLRFFSALPELRAAMRAMTRDEEEDLYASMRRVFTTQAAEKALLDLFQTGPALVNAAWKQLFHIY